ncbi:Signal transduction histidine kinase [Streptoalloteichus tenebrarius]|uniref:histidine kinase n=1 Tax=Streptoalloteichus tenebrarius (strain ATCC 17920 / DSM 40477 / JCM 4838 / CBS 697.72 / NBRC 16177 / NCIMB 11028 / NRRL B-12390 / A12253. 1 / ISP 5477) TaxID=1933 RepID=A0ABT1I1H8_STRSD|nr:Signal transduction histidine kinase [Streptoalloteichus tenebrarius]BFE99403.1 sensor histidine kinase [Streptoalloteichus tenebrarius]
MAHRRFLLGAWPWRSLGHLLGTALILLAMVPPVSLLCLPWAAEVSRLLSPFPLTFGTAVVWTAVGGVSLALGLPLLAVPLARLERRRLRLVDRRPVEDGRQRLSTSDLRTRFRVRYTESATWREVGYLLLLVVLGPLLCLVAGLVVLTPTMLLSSPFLVRAGEPPIAAVFTTVTTRGQALGCATLGLLLVPVSAYLLALLAGAHAAVARVLLHGGQEPLRAELVEVTRSRARLVDAFEAERRRIERDLHDGAQERLVSLTLRLGMARLDLPRDTPAYQNVSAAHDQAKQLMAELRELVRGIHPRVLTDRGLPAALGELADRCPVPVSVRADLPERMPAPVEATAYFVVSEALANVAKHSGADSVSITARREGGLLTVEVHDDGTGGADPDRGTGLTGLADRVAVIDGRMFLSSPAGGPTLLRVELPCDQNVRSA